jgi:hypothetical protein
MAIGSLGVPQANFTKSQIKATDAYAKGLIRIIEENGKIGVVSTITGQKFFSGGDIPFVEIMNEASKFGLSEFTPILGASGESITSGYNLDESPFQRLSDIVASLNESVFNNDDPYSRQVRKFVFGSEDARGPLQIERFGFINLKSLPAADPEQKLAPLQLILKEIADQTKEQYVGTNAGALFPDAALSYEKVGILNIQKDAAVLLRFKVGDKYLDSDLINRLLVRTGSQVLDPKKLAEILNAEETEDLLIEVGSGFGKGPKRVKAHTSARNFTMGSRSIQDFLISISEEKIKSQGIIESLADTILMVDHPFEAILKTLGLQDDYTDALLQSVGNTDLLRREAVSRERAATRLATKGYAPINRRRFF